MSGQQRLTEAIVAVLAAEGAVAVPALLTALRQRGWHRVSRRLVEQVLRDSPDIVAERVAERTVWRLADAHETPRPAVVARAEASAAPVQAAAGQTTSGQVTPPPTAQARARLEALDLRDWQAEALAAWAGTCRGVIEAVTGTGKTRLAIAAVRTIADRGGRTLVLVPTLELQQQWMREVRRLLPDLRVGRLGGGGSDDLFDHDVVVATPHAASGVPVETPSGTVGFVVADEAHRYGAPSWGQALPPSFPLRLALTATFERNDDGVAEVLTPYFGPVVFRYGYDRAVPDGMVAPFRIALAGVRLDADEQQRYDRADARLGQLHRELVGALGMPREPGALLAAVTAVVSEAQGAAGDPGAAGPQVRACREYLVRLRERRETAATAAGKLAVLRAAAPALAGRATLVFTDTVAQAEDAQRVLRGAGLAAETVHGELAAERRRIRLAVFRRGELDVLIAPRVLDEGVDVPDAEVAVALSAFRTRRQLIQRLGRVLRVKPDGREARLVLAYAWGTREDPAHGGHGEFLAQVRGVARELRTIDVDTAAQTLADWLCPDTSETDVIR